MYIKGLCTVKFVHTITIWEHSFLKGLPSPVPQYWYIEAILSPGVVLHKPHDNDIEAGSCHWIFNWYIFTCFLPRLFMLYSHWSWEWLYFAFLFSFNMRMLFSGTSKYLQTTAFFYLYLYLCYFFHSLRTWRSWAWKSQSIISSVTVTCPTWRRTRPDDSSWTDGRSIENIYRNPRDSHSFYLVLSVIFPKRHFCSFA